MQRRHAYLGGAVGLFLLAAGGGAFAAVGQSEGENRMAPASEPHQVESGTTGTGDPYAVSRYRSREGTDCLETKAAGMAAAACGLRIAPERALSARLTILATKGSCRR